MNKKELVEFMNRRVASRSTFARGIFKGLLHFYTRGKWVLASEVNPIYIPKQ